MVTDDSSFLELSLVWKGTSCFYGRKHKTGRSSCQVEKYVVCPCIIWRYVLYHQSTLFSVQWCTFCSRRPRNHNPLCVILRGNVISQIEKKYFWLLLLPSLKLCLRWDGHTQCSVYKLDFNTSSRTNNIRELNHIYTFSLYLINWKRKKTQEEESCIFLQMIRLICVAK